MSALRSVVYVSCATDRVTTASLETLLIKARTFNRVNGVTGVLLCADGSFMQCIEGLDDAVRETYSRVLASRQHHSVIELMNTAVDRRSFEAWHMGLAQAARSNLLTLSTVQWQKAHAHAHAHALGHPSSSLMGLELLKAFWKGVAR